MARTELIRLIDQVSKEANLAKLKAGPDQADHTQRICAQLILKTSQLKQQLFDGTITIFNPAGLGMIEQLSKAQAPARLYRAAYDLEAFYRENKNDLKDDAHNGMRSNEKFECKNVDLQDPVKSDGATVLNFLVGGVIGFLLSSIFLLWIVPGRRWSESTIHVFWVIVGISTVIGAIGSMIKADFWDAVISFLTRR